MLERNENPFWSYEDLALLIAAILPGVFIGTLLVYVSRVSSKGAQALIFQVTLIGLLLLVLWYLVAWRYDQPFWRSLGWAWPVPGLGWSVAAGPVLALAGSALGALLHAPEVEDPVKDLITGRFSLAIVMLFGVILGPIYEELFFRGFLYPLLAKSFGAAAGIVLSALPFALLHGSQNQWAWQQLTIIGIAGLVFGYVRWRTGSTVACTVVHAGFNLTQFVAFLALRGV